MAESQQQQAARLEKLMKKLQKVQDEWIHCGRDPELRERKKELQVQSDALEEEIGSLKQAVMRERPKYPAKPWENLGVCRVFLNVYTIPQLSVPGAYHSGIELMGQEWGYGKHDENSTGVYPCRPRRAPRFKYLQTVDLGEADLSFEGVDYHRVISELKAAWIGNEYDIVKRNCNHFTSALAHRLVGKGIPGWVNALAKMGNGLTSVFGRPDFLGPEAPDAVCVPGSEEVDKAEEWEAQERWNAERMAEAAAAAQAAAEAAATAAASSAEAAKQGGKMAYKGMSAGAKWMSSSATAAFNSMKQIDTSSLAAPMAGIGFGGFG